MINIIETGKKPGLRSQSSVRTVLLLALAMSVSGCYYKAANRDFQRPGGTAPWWCATSPAKPACLDLSLSFDIALSDTSQYATLANFTADGGTVIADRPDNIGVAYTNISPTPAPAEFVPSAPNVLLYDGSLPTSRLVGIAWEIDSATAPEGFAGNGDVWVQNATTGHWWLTAWVVRGYENHPNVFAASHPCLTSTGSTLSSTQNQCFIDSHPEPFEILVTNDDGYAAPGINALVEGLYGLPNVVVHVVAPSANQSGVGESETGTGFVVSGSPDGLLTTNPGGRPVTAVYSNDPTRSGIGSPVDAVRYAMRIQKLSPEIVLSGINAGQNIGSLTDVSGTVGAARIARRSAGVPAIASSQGRLVAPWDWPSGVTATLALLEEWRLGRTVNTNSSVLNINTPTCATGLFPRGTVQTVVAPDDVGWGTQNCASTATPASVISDIDAFNKGFISIADVGANKPPNWP
jgi:5'-nucleotidase